MTEKVLTGVCSHDGLATGNADDVRLCKSRDYSGDDSVVDDLLAAAAHLLH